MVTTSNIFTYDIVGNPGFSKAKMMIRNDMLEEKQVELLVDNWFNNVYKKKNNIGICYNHYEPVDLLAKVIKYEASLKTSPHKLDVVIMYTHESQVDWLYHHLASRLGCVKKTNKKHLDTAENAEIYFINEKERFDGRFTNLIIWYGFFNDLYDAWENTKYMMSKAKYFYFLKEYHEKNKLDVITDTGVELTTIGEWTEKDYKRALREKKLKRVLKY